MHEIAIKDPRAIAQQPVSVTAFIDAFLAAQDIRESSKATYRRYLRMFFSWIEKHATTPTLETVLAYKKDLIDSGATASTVSCALVAVRRFFAWTESENHYPNIAKNIRGAKRSKHHRKDPLTLEQAKDLLDFSAPTAQGKRDFAILNLMLRTGLRTIEIIRASVDDIAYKDGATILWIWGKGRDEKDEFVVLTPASLKPIQDYLATRGPVKKNDSLFTGDSPRNRGGQMTTRSISRIVKNHLLEIGIVSERITAHSLRHSTATFLLEGGASLQGIQSVLRHQNLTTTQNYLHDRNRIQTAPERILDAIF